ncbi:hypothetical protein MHU86_18537 [Fragilaria crotonensis]|nr:hypothetical protein MHU86_18537 [Fragilaria crotonensis]
MRAKFTNSSDDFGHFSQRSFADRLSSSPQSKWIPLTSPIEENLVEAVEHTGDSSDPAWDLRNIKARFAERQAKKANKTRVEEAGGADLWEPFEPFHFPETPVAFDSRQDKIGLREDYGQGGAITADELNLGKDNVVAGTPDLDIGAFQRPRSQQNQATNVHRGPVDPPPMGSSTPKRSIQFTKQPQAAIPTTQRKTAASIALQKQNVVTPQYLTVRSGTRPDEEEQSASTISSTRFGGRDSGLFSNLTTIFIVKLAMNMKNSDSDRGWNFNNSDKVGNYLSDLAPHEFAAIAFLLDISSAYVSIQRSFYGLRVEGLLLHGPSHT